jgi:streptomycin 6-kinase
MAFQSSGGWNRSRSSRVPVSASVQVQTPGLNEADLARVSLSVRAWLTPGYYRGDVGVPDLPAEMRRRLMVAWGDEVRGWLEAAPLIAARCASEWSLEPDATIVSGFDSWVLTCSDDRGQRRILKLIPDGRTARAQAETLLTWERLGASRYVGLVAFDEKDNAILLERVEPGGDGTTLADARCATHEAAAILADLHRPAPRGLDLPSLNEKVAGDLIFIRERLEPSAVTTAERLVSDLIASASPNLFILHADFSLRNMLDAGPRRGFVAIDPWGAVGERSFDVATWAAEQPPAPIAQRASALSDSLGLEEGRVLVWTRVLALLGAAQAEAFDQKLASALREYAEIPSLG